MVEISEGNPLAVDPVLGLGVYVGETEDVLPDQSALQAEASDDHVLVEHGDLDVAPGKLLRREEGREVEGGIVRRRDHLRLLVGCLRHAVDRDFNVRIGHDLFVADVLSERKVFNFVQVDLDVVLHCLGRHLDRQEKREEAEKERRGKKKEQKQRGERRPRETTRGRSCKSVRRNVQERNSKSLLPPDTPAKQNENSVSDFLPRRFCLFFSFSSRAPSSFSSSVSEVHQDVSVPGGENEEREIESSNP